MAKQSPDHQSDKPARPETLEGIPQTTGMGPQNTGAGSQNTVASLRNMILPLCSEIQRVLELGRVWQDSEPTIKVLRALMADPSRLAGLLKSQQQIAGAEENEATAAITRALHDLMDEWGIK